MKEKNIQELAIRMGLISVEDMCQYTIAQLVVKIANKVNELVGEVWRFETDVQEVLKTQNENIQYLLGEGLHLEVENIFDGWVQDGTFDTLLNQSALKKVNDRIDETNAQLSHIDDIVNHYPLKGVALCPQLNYTETMITFKPIIDKLITMGCDSVVISYNIKLGYRTTPSLYTNTLAISDEILDYCKGKFKKIIVKAHTLPERDDNIAPVDKVQWFSEYNNIINTLCEKGITDLIIHNEADKVTTSEYDSYWITIIENVKNRGIRVGTSLTYYQALEFTMFDQLDWIGLNLYPRLGYLTDSDTELRKSLWYDQLGRDELGLCNKLKRDYGKEIYITEIGTSSKVGSLSDPSIQTGVESETEQAKYLDIVLSVLTNCSAIDQFTLFSANGTVYKFMDKEAETVVVKWFGGVK